MVAISAFTAGMQELAPAVVEGTLDAAAGRAVYQRAREVDAGTEIRL